MFGRLNTEEVASLCGFRSYPTAMMPFETEHLNNLATWPVALGVTDVYFHSVPN